VKNTILTSVTLCAVGALLAGCSTTHEVAEDRLRDSGFLGDYSDLKKTSDWLRGAPDLKGVRFD